MLSREDHFMIKQLRKQGAHIVDIAHHIGCSERTVQRHLALPAPPSGKPSSKRKSKLDPFKDFIDQQLQAQVWNAEVILQKLKELGYDGGCTLVRQYIHPKRALRASKQTVRFETSPGYQLQHDWGQLRTEVGGCLQTVNIAVNVLGYSRYMHVWAGPRQDAEHTYESLVQAFAFFGGVPKTVLVDNQKAAVLNHNTDGEVRFNPGFLALADHYGFTPKACRPQRPRTKGKTERMVGYVKQHFFVRYRSFDSWSQLNQLLVHWLATVAAQRVLRQFDQTPTQRFAEEVNTLLPCPPHAFDTRYHDVRQVAWDSYIEVRGTRYSVPADYCGQQVVIRLSLDSQLSVYNLQDVCIAQHRLVEGSNRWQTHPPHHAALWAQVSPVQQRSLQAYEEATQ